MLVLDVHYWCRMYTSELLLGNPAKCNHIKYSSSQVEKVEKTGFKKCARNQVEAVSLFN